jgi:LPXTG-site transpeptidase (sortase) family protein
MSRILVILRWSFIGFGVVLLAWGTGILYLGDQPALAAPIQAAADLQSLLGDQYDPYLLSADQTQLPAEATPLATDSTNASSAAEAAVQAARPERLIIPIINLDAPVVEASSKKYRIRDVLYEQWIVPDKFAVGWSPNAGYPGQPGNVVLFGHHNVNGAVFANLYKLQSGDQINVIDATGQSFNYTVETVLKLKERGVSFDQMVENAQWIRQTQDQRLTLVTCWPPYQSTYRLIVVARPSKVNNSNSGAIP